MVSDLDSATTSQVNSGHSEPVSTSQDCSSGRFKPQVTEYLIQHGLTNEGRH